MPPNGRPGVVQDIHQKRPGRRGAHGSCSSLGHRPGVQLAAYLSVGVGCDDDGVVTDGEHSVGFDTAVFGEGGE